MHVASRRLDTARASIGHKTPQRRVEHMGSWLPCSASTEYSSGHASRDRVGPRTAACPASGRHLGAAVRRLLRRLPRLVHVHHCGMQGVPGSGHHSRPAGSTTGCRGNSELCLRCCATGLPCCEHLAPSEVRSSVPTINPYFGECNEVEDPQGHSGGNPAGGIRSSLGQHELLRQPGVLPATTGLLLPVGRLS